MGWLAELVVELAVEQIGVELVVELVATTVFAAAAYPLARGERASVVELVEGLQQALDTQKVVTLVVTFVG